MSPEQAQAKALDRRTDVWAFGCLLYELLAGRRAFPGDTPSEVLMAVVGKEPAWKSLPKEVPGRVRLLLRRCLEKDPQKRLRDIGDARLELEEVLSGAVVESEDAGGKRRPVWPALAAGLLLGAAVMGAAMWMQARPAPPPQIARFEVPLQQGHIVRTTWNPQIMFTRDGSGITYVASAGGSPMVFRRPLNSLTISPLVDMKFLATIVFSPDGKWITWRDDPSTELRKMSAGGGAPVTLATADHFSRGDWGADGYIYFTEKYPAAISRIPENGGKKEPVTELDAARQEFVHKHAQILPGGRALIFTVVAGGMESYDDARVELQVLGTNQRKVLVQGGFCARYSPSGHIVYARGGSLYAVPFDVGRLEVTGPSVKVAEGVLMSTNVGSAYFDVSANGALAFAAGVAEGGKRTLVWVDRQGKAEPLPLPERSYLFPRISPDQKTLAVEIEGPTHNLYTYDFGRGVMTKMTTDGLSHAPVWTPDGRQICFRSWKAGTMTMWRMPAERSGPEERLTAVGAWQSPVSISSDGRYLAFNQGMMPTGIFVLSLDGSAKPQPLSSRISAMRPPNSRPTANGSSIAPTSPESLKSLFSAGLDRGPESRSHRKVGPTRFGRGKETRSSTETETR
jgi:serine/threonine-protein kinase